MQNITALVNHLVHPFNKAPLRLVDSKLVGENGDTFPVRDSIPRFVGHVADTGQKQVQEAFAYKWEKYDWGHEEKSRSFYLGWVRESFGCASDEKFFNLLKGREKILDAGCGSGIISSYLAPSLSEALIFNVDISSSIDAALNYNTYYSNAFFVQADINELPFPYEFFDAIFSLGVLHHTPNTWNSLRTLVRYLRRDGEIFLYLYKKKSPIREFTDDFLRERLSGFPPERAWQETARLTKFGKYLSDLKLTIHIPEDIPVLGFQQGEVDLQRFFYWHILKCFWNDEMNFDHNVLVNFDWYYPKYAHRHGETEIRKWLDELGLLPRIFNDVESGFYIAAKRK
jgi:SAM-dependent methyltransferase